MLAPLSATVPRSEGQRPVRRKLQRLFAVKTLTELIKRCNDFACRRCLCCYWRSLLTALTSTWMPF